MEELEIKRIHIDPSWKFSDEYGNCIDSRMFELLRAVHSTGKLTKAASVAGVSYRHAWNLLKKWDGVLGAPIVLLERGRGAKLTELGESLLWAEQRVAARLKPQLDNLASEINAELHRAISGSSAPTTVHASHGYAVAQMQECPKDFQLNLQYKSPLEALQGLNRGACDFAGVHIPNGLVIPALIETYQSEFKKHRAVKFVTREQGLIVRKGNPKKIISVANLSDDGVTFINRQFESGTRMVFDQLLSNQDVPAQDIQGYEDQEYTHGAIAAYVAAGMADVGFGVRAAASQFDLDFIPLVSEDYVFLCSQQSLNTTGVQQFIDLLKSEAFQAKIEDLPGYHCSDSGEVEMAMDLLYRDDD